MQQTLTILSRSVISTPSQGNKKLIGTFLCNIVNLLHMLPITLLTWILRCAIACVSSTSLASSQHHPLVNAGILTSGHIIPTLSLISNPWSVNTTSPNNSLLSSPQFSVMCLSEAHPLHPLEINNTLLSDPNEVFHSVRTFVVGKGLHVLLDLMAFLCVF